MVNLNPTNLFDEVDKCHCETLFDPNCGVSDLCLITLGEADDSEVKPVNLVVLDLDHSERAGEEHDIMTLEREFLISCDGLVELGVTEIVECSRIFCLNKINVEVFEVVDDGGENNFTRYDDSGYCWLIRTNRCQVLELSEWTPLFTQATS